MNKEVNFDVNLISKISFRPSYLNVTYKWRNETITQKYKRFLWFKWRSGLEIKPEGFYEDRSDYYGNTYWNHVHEDIILRYGYMIKDVGVQGGISKTKEVLYKAYVEINLGYKSTIDRSFESNKEARDWVTKLKTMSNKIFEVYEY